jgi:hypothetical protein
MLHPLGRFIVHLSAKPLLVASAREIRQENRIFIIGPFLFQLRPFQAVGPNEEGGLNNKAASQAPSHSGRKKLDSAILYPVGEKVRCSSSTF